MSQIQQKLTGTNRTLSNPSQRHAFDTNMKVHSILATCGETSHHVTPVSYTRLELPN